MGKYNLAEAEYPTAIFIDPRRITDRLFGGPYFAKFRMINDWRALCEETGDVFDIRGLDDAWMESRNLAPIIQGARGKL